MRTDRVLHLATGPKLWTDADVAAWKHACDVHGVDPIALLKCAAHESGCSPAAVHKWTDAKGVVHYGAAGLIQVIPSNLSSLGFHGTPQDFAELTVEEQSKYVGNYLGWFPALKGKGLAGVYTGLFLPALIAVAEKDPDEPICGEHGPFAEYYEPNIVFDEKGRDGKRKGYITGRDLMNAAEAAFDASPVARDVATRLDPSFEDVGPISNPLRGATQPLDIPGMTAPSDEPNTDEG